MAWFLGRRKCAGCPARIVGGGDGGVTGAPKRNFRDIRNKRTKRNVDLLAIR